MRILAVGSMYPPHHLGGYELVWQSGVRHLRERGHEVRVLTTGHRLAGAGPEEDTDVHRELRWYWHDHAFPRMTPWERLALERDNAAVLERHLRELAPDAVAWWAMGGMSLSLVERVRRAGIPAAAVVGDDWLVYGPQVDGWLALWGGRPRLVRFAERRWGIPATLGSAGIRWCFISRTVLRRAREAGWAIADATVAHPGVDTDLFSPLPAGPWGWRLLYAGRLDVRKGLDTAVEALVGLPAEARLTIDGPGDERHAADLRRRARALGLEDRVRFQHSRRVRLPDVYAGADAVLFPVEWDEPWGLVPLEAMAVGRPVVATGRGGSGEYLRDGENCVLFEAGDAEALAAALTRLAGDGALRERLRAGGEATAERHTAAAFDAAVADLLEDAAG